MVRLSASKTLRLIVIVLYALAVLGIFVARHPASEVNADTAGLMSAELPGGSVLVLCQHDNGDSSPQQDGKIDHGCCDACVLAHAPGLGAVAGPEIPAQPIESVILGHESARSAIAVWRAAPTSRGPPLNA